MQCFSVKIGGSIATNKNDELHPQLFENNVRSCLDSIDLSSLNTLVFGVGAYGHKRSLEIGISEVKGKVLYSEVSDFLKELDEYYEQVMTLLKRYSVNFEFYKLDTYNDFLHLDASKKRNDMIPVYFGSVVYQDEKAVIVSGDAIIAKVAGDCDIIFFTDVEGVMLKDGTYVTEFDMNVIDNLLSTAQVEEYEDATGGMVGKLEKLKKFGFKNKVIFRNIHES